MVVFVSSPAPAGMITITIIRINKIKKRFVKPLAVRVVNTKEKGAKPCIRTPSVVQSDQGE
jgi:hypothetical protein